MTSNEFIRILQSNGLSGGDILTVVAYLVSDLDRVTLIGLKQSLPLIKQKLAEIKIIEERELDRLFKDEYTD
jgi:hypothetical protein